MISLFYISSILFIYVEIFQIINRNTIYKRFSDISNISLNPFLLISFYILKLYYFIWIPIGLLTNNWIYFAILIGLGLFKYPILLTKNNFCINLYDLMNTIISCFILITILVTFLLL
jgi:hypothetical protein